MKITWDKYKKDGCSIDYYGITLKNGVVNKNRIYYKLDASMIASINPFFDKLILRHFLECFSIGHEYGVDHIKYDMKVATYNAYDTLDCIVDFLEFCPKSIIEDIRHIFNKHDKKFDFRVFGVTMDPLQNKTNSACFYFYTHEKIDVAKCADFVNDLLHVFIHNDKINERICWPICNENGYLCFIALDFTSLQSKIKFYFELLRDYDRHQFLKVFNKTENLDIVSDILSANAQIGAFQVAITKDGQISYNFYLQEERCDCQ